MRAAFDQDYGAYLGHPLDPRAEDDDTIECEACGGTGHDSEGEECAECEGLGRFDEEGVPFRLLRSGERDYGRGFAA